VYPKINVGNAGGEGGGVSRVCTTGVRLDPIKRLPFTSNAREDDPIKTELGSRAERLEIVFAGNTTPYKDISVFGRTARNVSTSDPRNNVSCRSIANERMLVIGDGIESVESTFAEQSIPYIVECTGGSTHRLVLEHTNKFPRESNAIPCGLLRTCATSSPDKLVRTFPEKSLPYKWTCERGRTARELLLESETNRLPEESNASPDGFCSTPAVSTYERLDITFIDMDPPYSDV
jgi:hypothetical protein